MASLRASYTDEDKKGAETKVNAPQVEDEDAEFGGHEARKVLERKLLRKIDLRMSILVVIYILNYVSVLCLSTVTLV